MKKPSDPLCLIQQLIKNTGIREDTAINVLLIVSEFAKEKLPVLRGNIQSFVQVELRNYRSKN